jgi:hypothetical protein
MTAKNEKNVRLPDSIMISVYFFNVKFPLFSLSVKKKLTKKIDVFIHLVRSTLFVTRRLFLDNTLGPN